MSEQGLYLLLDGSAGGQVATPDSSTNSPTGDLDLRVKVALDDWSSGSVQTVLGKWVATGNQRSFLVSVDATGFLRLQWSNNGTANISKTSTAPIPATDGEPLWLRVTLDVDNGASANVVTFYTSTDGQTWTQLGTPVTTAGTTSVFNSTSPVAIAPDVTATVIMAGKVHEAELRSGIGGAIFASPDFTRAVDDGSPAGTLFTDEQANAWTTAGTAQWVLASVPPSARRWSGSRQLDLPAGMGQRFETIRWDVLTADLQYAFTCTQVNRDGQIPSVRFDANAEINRTISRMWFGPDDTAQINPLSHLLAPRWVLDDGTTFPMGVFHFSNLPLASHSWGDVYMPSLADSSTILRAGRRGTYSIPVGKLLTTAAREIIAEVGLSARAAIDNSSTYATSPQLFPPNTSRKAILSWICQALGYYPPYFDNDGFLRLRAVPNPISEADPDAVYTEDANGRIVRDSIDISSNILDAPNVYRVIGSPAAGGEVVGEYRIPASAPNSEEHRGFEIVKTINNQNVHNKPDADVAAQAEHVNDHSTYVQVAAATAPDPRHDGMWIVNFRGSNWREQSWDLEGKPGGRMGHVWQAVWQAA